MDNILEVSGLRKSYGSFALKDVTFSLPEGCITGFIGVNGAGKSTTLRTILRLTHKEGSTIRFFGLDMEQNEREIKNRLGIVLDDGLLIMDEPTSGLDPLVRSQLLEILAD